MRRGQYEQNKDTYEAAEAILGGTAVWLDDAMLAYQDQASGESLIYGGVALHDAVAGEVFAVFKQGMGIGLATDAEDFPAGSPLKINTTTGKWELSDGVAEMVSGRAITATSGGTGEFFEVELFYPPHPAA